VLAKFGHLDAIPEDAAKWGVNAANAGTLARTLVAEKERALLFRDLATLRTHLPLFGSVDDLEWRGPTERFEALGKRLDQARSIQGDAASHRR
jgi:hypothetical protein